MGWIRAILRAIRAILRAIRAILRAIRAFAVDLAKPCPDCKPGRKCDDHMFP